MDLIDRLTVDAQTALARGDKKEYNVIMAEIKRLVKAEQKKNEWDEQMKGKVTTSNK